MQLDSRKYVSGKTGAIHLSVCLSDCAEPTAEQAKRLMEIRAQLQLIKRRIRDEHIQVPARLARLLESEPDDKG